MVNVAIVGAGHVGQIRARVIRNCPEACLKVVADLDMCRARELAESQEARAESDWRRAATSLDVDVVIVATPTKFHREIAVAALDAGKHVLCEKPLARSVDEAEEMVEASIRSGRILWTGFNYRYMAHARKAKELIDANKLGPIYLLRSRYGHGGRPGYESSWCADADLSGGGVLLEQGVHILDQVRFLLGEPSETLTLIQRYFWNFPEVEDNCFCLLRAATGETAQLHISWTQWVNMLEIEIYGREGYLRLEGRDGHYGPQRLIWGSRKSDHSRPAEELFEFPSVDTSWEREWADLLNAIRLGSDPFPYALNGLRVQLLVEAAYRSSREHAWVSIRKPELHSARVA